MLSQRRNRFGLRSDAETRGSGLARGLVRRLDRGLARGVARGVVMKIFSAYDAWAASERVVFDLSSEREAVALGVFEREAAALGVFEREAVALGVFEREAVALGVFARARALVVFAAFMTD